MIKSDNPSDMGIFLIYERINIQYWALDRNVMTDSVSHATI